MTMQSMCIVMRVTTFRPISGTLEPAARERRRAPVSADSTGAAIAADRASPPTRVTPSAAERGARALDGDPVRVAIVGATGYVGAELIRLLARHPQRDDHRPRRAASATATRSRTSTRPRDDAASQVFDQVPDDAEAVFLALPHGTVATRIDEFLDHGPDRDRPRPGLPAPRPRRLPDLVPLRAPAARAARDRRLRPARAAPRGAGRAWARSRARSSARRAATRRPRSSPSLRSPAPGSSTTWSSTRSRASRAPAATPSRTSTSAR